MKKSFSVNTWGDSTWDGVSVYMKKTQEQNADGSYVTITADFRRHECVEDSIADHCAYLLEAKNGSKLRLMGLKGVLITGRRHRLSRMVVMRRVLLMGTSSTALLRDGEGSDKGWGKQMSGAGWISLDYCEIE